MLSRIKSNNDALLGLAAGVAVGHALSNNSRPTEVHHYTERTVVQQAPQQRYFTYPSTKPIQTKVAPAPAQAVAPVTSQAPEDNIQACSSVLYGFNHSNKIDFIFNYKQVI